MSVITVAATFIAVSNSPPAEAGVLRPESLVYDVTPDGHLHEKIFVGYRWTDADRSSSSTPVGVGRPLAAIPRNADHSPRIYYSPASGQVHELGWTGQWWSEQNLTGLYTSFRSRVRSGNTMAATGVGPNNDMRVYFIAEDGHVYELARRANWELRDLTTDSGGSPVAPDTTIAVTKLGSATNLDAGIRVYTVGTDQQVHELRPGTLHWIDQVLTRVIPAAPAAPGSPVAAVTTSGGAGIEVFYRGFNGLLHELRWTGTTWQDWGGSFAMAASGPMAMTETGSGQVGVYFATPERHVYQAVVRPGSGLYGTDLTPVTGVTIASNGRMIATGAGQTSDPRVYVTGPNGHLYDLFWTSGSGWSSQDVSTATNTVSAPGAGIAAIS